MSGLLVQCPSLFPSASPAVAVSVMFLRSLPSVSPTSCAFMYLILWHSNMSLSFHFCSVNSHAHVPHLSSQIPEFPGHREALDQAGDTGWVTFTAAVAAHPVLIGQPLLSLLTEPCQRAIRYSTEAEVLLKAASSGDQEQVPCLLACLVFMKRLEASLNHSGE